MSDLLTAFGSLFTFLITQMGAIATFFTSNLIGQIILGIAVFSVVFSIITTIVDKLK